MAFAATVRVDRAAPGLALFAAPGEHAAVVRFSRGFGLPEPLPEILPRTSPITDERDLPELTRRAAQGALNLELRMATLTGPWQPLTCIDVGDRSPHPRSRR